MTGIGLLTEKARSRLGLVVAAAVMANGCVYQHAKALRAAPTNSRVFDFSKSGEAPNPVNRYYFTSLKLGPNNTDELFVVLTFSGGGTRAAALAYGVLDELRRIKIGCTDPRHGETCGGKTLLDEVDVISSVSGGSFTAAYYALQRGRIFDPSSDFQKRFLHANPERELFGEAVHYPQNWLRLLSRPEIAAHLWSKLMFGNATYADLANGTRPFVIINSSDYLSQHRFQFTQDRFDWLCDDLDRFPLSRAVAASSAFPGLLNSLTLNTFNGSHCPVDRAEPQWVGNAMLPANQFEDRPSYREALSYRAFSDSHEKYLHLLDGGLTDNLGLREVYAGLRGSPSASVPLLKMSNSGLIKNALIIVVNARPGDSSGKLYQPNAVPMGPITLPVIGATSSLPMGTVSYDTVDMFDELREIWQQAREKHPNFMNVYAIELTFENISDPLEREFFQSVPTDFALPGSTVDCLAVEGRHLLLAARPYGGASPTPGAVPPAFADYVRDVLRGFMPADTQQVVVSDGKCSVQ